MSVLRDSVFLYLAYSIRRIRSPNHLDVRTTKVEQIEDVTIKIENFTQVMPR